MASEELRDGAEASAIPFTDTADAGTVRPWEEIDTGRFQPRRIKGSCKGRALG